MLNRDEIVKLLMSEFNDVYCWNCEGNNNEEFSNDACEECHRKNMNWSVSRLVVERLADKIVGK